MAEPIKTVGDLAGVCGHDGTDWIKALIDATGHLQVDVVDSGGADLKDVLDKLSDILTELLAKLETSDLDLDVYGKLSTNAHGHVGGAWQKQPLVFGYSGTVSESITNNNLGGGLQSEAGMTVPSGEAWVVNAITGRVSSGTCTSMELSIIIDGDVVHTLVLTPPTSGQYYVATGSFVLAEDDYVRWRGTGLTAGDDMVLRYAGYKMDIDL